MSYSHGPWEVQSDYDSRPFEDFTVEDVEPDEQELPDETLWWLRGASFNDEDPLSNEEALAELDKELNWWW